MKEYVCVWKDEFDSSNKIDLDKWEFSVGGHGWGNGELQYYTDNRDENIMICNNKLVIRSNYESWQGNQFTSAKIISKESWKYGKIRVRAKIPLAVGTWPTIWMLPISYDGTNWPYCGEVDIVEHFGHTRGEIFFSLHSGEYNFYKNNKFHKRIQINEKINNFNIYELEWNEESMIFSVNDKVCYVAKKSECKNFNSQEWPFDNHFRLIINLAVGGYEAGKKGIDIDKWPQDFIIDYVHVYQQK